MEAQWAQGLGHRRRLGKGHYSSLLLNLGVLGRCPCRSSCPSPHRAPRPCLQHSWHTSCHCPLPGSPHPAPLTFSKVSWSCCPPLLGQASGPHLLPTPVLLGLALGPWNHSEGSWPPCGAGLRNSPMIKTVAHTLSSPPQWL